METKWCALLPLLFLTDSLRAANTMKRAPHTKRIERSASTTCSNNKSKREYVVQFDVFTSKRTQGVAQAELIRVMAAGIASDGAPVGCSLLLPV